MRPWRSSSRRTASTSGPTFLTADLTCSRLTLSCFAVTQLGAFVDIDSGAVNGTAFQRIFQHDVFLSNDWPPILAGMNLPGASVSLFDLDQSLSSGGESTPSHAVALCAGYAYRLQTKHLKNEFGHHGPLQPLLLRYTQTLITEMSMTAACNRHHSVEQQLCRWLLSTLDRLPANKLATTQVQIADMLGVRRESITQFAGKLQRAGLIHYSRGHIAVLDRAGLEALACECYAVVRKESERLLPARPRLVP